VRRRVYLLVDEFYRSFFVDVERPALGIFAPLMDDAESAGGFFRRITENRIIELE
jgi:hypothetical protein